MNVTAQKHGGWNGWRIFRGLVAMALVSACAAAAVDYIHPKYDFSLVRKVAVLPLENLSTDQLAAERVRKSVVSEMLAAGVLDVIETAQVNRVLGEQQIQSVSSMSAKQIQEVAKSLGVQALVVGSVDGYDRINVGGGSFAEVAVTLRAVDAATGEIVWSTTKSGGGVGVMGRLFGFGGDSMHEATQKAVRAAVATLFQ